MFLIPVKDEGSGPKSLVYPPPHLSKLISLADSWPLADPRLFQAHRWAFALAISLSSPRIHSVTFFMFFKSFCSNTSFRQSLPHGEQESLQGGDQGQASEAPILRAKFTEAGGREQKQLSNQAKYLMLYLESKLMQPPLTLYIKIGSLIMPCQVILKYEPRKSR